MIFLQLLFSENGVVLFINSVTTLLNEINHERQNIQQDVNRCEFFGNRLLTALRHTYNIVLFCERCRDIGVQTLTELKVLRSNLKSLYKDICSLPVMNMYQYCPQVERSGRRGHPRFSITTEQLQCLRNEFNSWEDIAKDLGVSRQTIYNRGQELGFSLRFESYTAITEDELDNHVRQEEVEFPGTGETNMIAGL